MSPSIDPSFFIALHVERRVPIEAKRDHSNAARRWVGQTEGVAGVGLAAERPPRLSQMSPVDPRTVEIRVLYISALTTEGVGKNYTPKSQASEKR